MSTMRLCKDKSVVHSKNAKGRAFKKASIRKISACFLFFASTSTYAQSPLEPSSVLFGSETPVSSLDATPIQNVNKERQSENPPAFEIFSDDARQWKIDLFSGVVQLSDGSHLKDREVYRSIASLERSILPVFKDVKVDAFFNRVYISALEREQSPVSDAATAPPIYRLKTLAFDPIAQGKLIWSFDPESAAPSAAKERLDIILSKSDPLSIKITLVANADSDVLTLKLLSPTYEHAFEWSIDASSGNVLFFQSF